ncbi:MAG: sugar-binding protein [Synergistaceae bacterium]|jgi:putative multiple sugar transport system substrate-binding protein|nr:sugar-binding protein [Synergistaceae bacterium]
MKKTVCLFLALILAASVAFAASGKELVGVVMPTRSEERWNKDGAAVKEGLEKLGYAVDLQFSDDDIPTQVRQIEDLITKGVKVLVIASIDGSALSDVLANAAAAKIPIIAYDRLLMKSPNVDYYVSFDNYKVGRQMGEILVKGAKLDSPAKKPLNIELFAGSPDDNNSVGFWDGAIDVLKPYFDNGTLVVLSKQTERTVCGTLRWDAAEAQKRMENLLSAFYTDATLDLILSPYDPISLSCLEACKAVGYGSAGKPLPLVGGQDCIVASCKSILAGEQYATVLKDTRSLGAATVTLVDNILTGKPVGTLDTTSYNNGAKIVPSLLLDSVIVTKDNLKKDVVDTGYHTAAEVGL